MGNAQSGDSYSREQGISAYRKRRRKGRVARIIVGIILVAIIGGASYAFGKQFINPESVPFDLPGVDEAAPVEEVGQAEVQEPTTIQPTTLSLVSAGDVILDGEAAESGRTESGAYDFGHLFEKIKGEIASFDLRIVNQETAISGQKFGFGAPVPLNAPQDLGRAEKDAGFNVVLRATDHALDTGAEGIHSELQWWHDNFAQMPVLGIADEKPEDNPALSDYVSDIYVFNKDGFKVAVLNHSVDISESDADVVSSLTQDKIAKDVAKAREKGAEMIVACPHWGEEGNSNVTDEQRRYAWIYANEGVDVIIGTHPRVLQPVEVLQCENGHKAVCFYSLGNLISSLTDNGLMGGLAEVQLSRNDQGVCEVTSATLKPVITHRGNGTDYCTYLFSKYQNDILWTGWDGWPDVDEWNRRLQELLGNGYDPSAREYRVDLNTTTSPVPEEPKQAEGDTKANPNQQQKDNQQEAEEGVDDEYYGDDYYFGDYGYGWDY